MQIVVAKGAEMNCMAGRLTDEMRSVGGRSTVLMLPAIAVIISHCAGQGGCISAAAQDGGPFSWCGGGWVGEGLLTGGAVVIRPWGDPLVMCV